MSALDESARAFLSLRRLAVAGVSRDGRATANALFRKLRDARYEVFPVNPNAREVEGVLCYPDVGSIPGKVEGVLIATPPAATVAVTKDCAAAGVSWIWMHRLIGRGSVAAEAVQLCRARGIHVIDGACPMMYLAPVDPFHRCFRWLLGVTGGLPKGR